MLKSIKPLRTNRRTWLGTVGAGLAGAFIASRTRATPAEVRLRWCWCGAVNDTSATLVAAFDGAATVDAVLIAEDGTRVDVPWVGASATGGIFRLRATGLRADTTWQYAFRPDMGPEIPGGTFRTFPRPGTPASFRVAMGSCNTRRNNPVFRAIANQKPLLFMHNGDLHYDNITSNNPDDFRRAFERELSDEAEATLYRSCVVSYMWDDHDYGANNAGHDNPSRDAAHRVYRERVPHWPLPMRAAPANRAPPIFQAFSIGRVRFVLTDLRSEAQREPGTILGRAQRERFFAEMATAARTHKLIVWMSSVPWIDADDRDGWGGAQDERRIVANFIRDQRIPVCIISGDAHMVAIDDGRNADFADGGGAPIPVFQAASLGQRASYKGGPYSHGACPGEGQFGLMDIVDDSTTLSVTWSARAGQDGLGDSEVSAVMDASGPIRYRFEVK